VCSIINLEPTEDETVEGHAEDEDELPTCSNCEEPRGKSWEYDYVDVPCPECMELLPEGAPERERLYSSGAHLTEHVLERHGDYSLAAAWRDQQKKTTTTPSVWSCPSKRCPWSTFWTASDFESHLLSAHLTGNEKRIPVKYLYSIARFKWGDVQGYRLVQLEDLERRMYQAEDAEVKRIEREMLEFNETAMAL
jgi:hypothetical protein